MATGIAMGATRWQGQRIRHPKAAKSPAGSDMRSWMEERIAATTLIAPTVVRGSRRTSTRSWMSLRRAANTARVGTGTRRT
jgi:hypothetical protein